MKTQFQEGQSDLINILIPPPPEPEPPPPPPKRRSDRTPAQAIQEIIDIGWTVEHQWAGQLNDLDELPDGIDRVFLNVQIPGGDLLVVVFDYESGNFFTQDELWDYLYGNN